MSDSEFYHEALIRRIKDRDDCDDDLRGACDEIEDCYETIERLRMTDAEREAIRFALDRLSGALRGNDECDKFDTLSLLLERLGGER